MLLVELRRFENCCCHTCDIAMMLEEELWPAKLRRDISDMTRRWSDVQRGRADRHDVVDLARMDDADKLIAHDHDVKISR